MAFRATPRLAGGATYLWVSARAKNALRRISVLGGIAAGVFVVAIIAFVIVPRRASRSAQTVAATTEAKEDSTASVTVRQADLRKIAVADSLVAAARRNSQPAALPADTFPAAIIARRETLSVAISKLTALIQRTEETPLASSYRALATNALVASEPQIPVLLDSLAAVERDRAAYGSIGAIDPGYAALSSRASNIGRAIAGVAAGKRERLRGQLNAIKPVAPAVTAPTVFVDTLRYLTERAAAQTQLRAADAEISRVRAQNQRVDAQLEHARELANLGAPPWAMLAAALVLAAALGFAGSLAVELRRPHVADAREAEQVAGERVLTVIGPATTVVERGRRQTDVGAPPLIDVVSEAYRALYLHIASVGAGLPVVTVTGDEHQIVGTVASNLAASAAYEARSALLVDVDATTCSVAGVLRVAPDPGLSGILSGGATWAEAIKPTTIGRDRPLDVLPSGSRRAGMLEPHVTEAAKSEFLRLQKRYDFIIISAPTSYVQRTETSVIPSPEVLLTARIGHTRLSTLKSAAESLRGTNMKIQGIVLWNAPFPHIDNREDLVNAARRGARAE